MKKCAVKLFFFILVIMILAGCQHNSIIQETDVIHVNTESEEVKIPAIFLVNTVSGEKSNEELVNSFNSEYEGKYHIDVEWLAGDESDYRAKIKLLNSTNELPAIITDVGFDYSFYELLVKYNRIVNIRDYVEKDESWNNFIEYDSFQDCMEEDGSIYLFPLVNQLYYSGIYYNTELFQEAGIEKFPETWEEFFITCDKLKAANITPISLHTIGTAWIPMLFCSAYLGSTPEGREFMNQQYPETYNKEVFIDAIQFVKSLFEYTTEDAIDGDFDTAAWHFYEGETAMLANGEWMVGNFSNSIFVEEDLGKQIKFHSFPEGVMVGSVQMTGWEISTDYDEEVIQGALEFMKYRLKKDEMDYSKSVEDYEKGEAEQLVMQYMDQLKAMQYSVPNYQIKWNPLVQNRVFINSLPKYLKGLESIDSFIMDMNDAVNEYENEQ